MEIRFEYHWTNEISRSIINDFRCVLNAVLYKGRLSEELFERKFLKNIYGPSIIVVAYDGEKPIGTQALLRNDIGEQVAYQGVDSAVLPEYEGLVLFPDMLEISKKEIKKKYPIYGFPNSKAFPISKLLKHKIVAIYRHVYFISPSVYAKEHSLMIPKNYALWQFKNSSVQYSSLKCLGHYYLVTFVKKRWGVAIMDIVGEIDKETAELFPHYQGHLFLLTYKSSIPRFYNKNRKSGFIITNQGAPINYVPYWKNDIF